ncbi:MAG: hypothetical protein KGI58_03100 [Patescibacteria group bacterium]|nr:hypothetical protein [Patescibacteria group bacterium]
MENKTEINGKKYLNTLKDLKKDLKAFSSYEVKTVYYLSLINTMDFCPAVINGTERMVLSTDKDLIMKIGEKITPREFSYKEAEFYVHKNDPVGYPTSHWSDKDENIMPHQLITEEEFKILSSPFIWTPRFHKNCYKTFKELQENTSEVF